MARQAHTRHHIDVDHAQPVLVGDLGEGLGFVVAQVVHQDVRVRPRFDQPGRALCAALIGDHGRYLAAWCRGSNPLHRGIQLVAAAPGDGDRHAFARERGRNGQANAGRCAGDDGSLAAELQIHDAGVP